MVEAERVGDQEPRGAGRSRRQSIVSLATAGRPSDAGDGGRARPRQALSATRSLSASQPSEDEARARRRRRCGGRCARRRPRPRAARRHRPQPPAAPRAAAGSCRPRDRPPLPAKLEIELRRSLKPGACAGVLAPISRPFSTCVESEGSLSAGFVAHLPERSPDLLPRSPRTRNSNPTLSDPRHPAQVDACPRSFRVRRPPADGSLRGGRRSRFAHDRSAVRHRLTTRIDTPLRSGRSRPQQRALRFRSLLRRGPSRVSLALAQRRPATPAIAHSMPRPDLAASAGTSASAAASGRSFRSPPPSDRDDRARAGGATLDDGARIAPADRLDRARACGVPGARAAGRTRRDRPRIAICMATYDPPLQLLERQIESIRDADARDWVCVISDDGSSPEKLAALERAARRRLRASSSPRSRAGWASSTTSSARCGLRPPRGRVHRARRPGRSLARRRSSTLLADRLGTATLAYSDARHRHEDGRVALRDVLEPAAQQQLRLHLAAARQHRLGLGGALPPSRGRARAAVPARVRALLPRPLAGARRRWRSARSPTSIGPSTTTCSTTRRSSGTSARRLGRTRAAECRRGCGHFRDDPSYFYEHWRTTYFQEYCRLVVIARLLLARCATGALGITTADAAAAWPKPSGHRRRSRGSPSASLRRLAGYDETLGAEGRLLRAFAWRRLLEAQPPKPSAAHRWLPRQSAFPVDRAGVMATPQSRTPVAAPATRPEARTR